MKTVQHKDEIKNDLARNILLIEFPDEDEADISSDDGNVVAESMTLKQSISNNGEFGGGIASEFSIHLINTNERRFGTSLKGKWINVSITHQFIIPIYPNGELFPSDTLFPGGECETETVQLFSGYIDDVIKDSSDNSSIKIIAYDIFAKMNTYKITDKVRKLFTMNYPISGMQYANDIGAPLIEFVLLCTSKNLIKPLPFNTSDFYNISRVSATDISNLLNNIHQRNKPWESDTTDVTYGDILRWISELFGGYAIIEPNNKYGKLSIITQKNTETYNSYFSCESEDYTTFPYDGIAIKCTRTKAEAYGDEENEKRVTTTLRRYKGDSDYLTICFAPQSSWLSDNERLYATIVYEDVRTSETYSITQERLLLSNKKITDERYVNDYGDKTIYSAHVYLYESENYRINTIRFYGNNRGSLTWNVNNMSVENVSKLVFVLLDNGTAVELSDVLTDFSYYDMTKNIFAWDETIETTGGSVAYDLGKITRFYNDGHLKYRLGANQFIPFKASVEGRTWVEVGDIAKIIIPYTDYDGCIYDSVTGYKMNYEGYIVDETGAYIYSDGTRIPYDEDTGEYIDEPVSGTIRTKEIKSIILSRTLSGIQALTDELETKGE